MNDDIKKIIQAIEEKIAEYERLKLHTHDSTDLALLIGNQGGLIEAKIIILKQFKK